MPNPNPNVNRRPPSLGAIGLLLGALLAAPCFLALPGCSEREDADDDAAAKATDPAEAIRTDVYIVRGEVLRVPAASDPSAEFIVHHEAIPHYRASAAKLGMNTMAMPFPVAPDLSLEGVKAGDKIELTFEVQFDTEKDRPIAYQATAVELLPADTELDFTPLPKKPPSAP